MRSRVKPSAANAPTVRDVAVGAAISKAVGSYDALTRIRKLWPKLTPADREVLLSELHLLDVSSLEPNAGRVLDRDEEAAALERFRPLPCRPKAQ